MVNDNPSPHGRLMIYGLYICLYWVSHISPEHWVFHGFPHSERLEISMILRVRESGVPMVPYWMGEDVNVETITVCKKWILEQVIPTEPTVWGKNWMLLLDRTGMLARHFPFFPEQFWSGFVCKNRPMSEETHHSFHLRPLNNKNLKWLQYNMGSHVWRKPFEECSTYCLPSFCMASTTGAQPCSAVKPMRRCTRQLTNHVQPKPNWVNGPRNIQFNDVFHVQSHDHPFDFWVKAISSGFGFDGFPGKELL